jgi:hypothetical protein
MRPLVVLVGSFLFIVSTSVSGQITFSEIMFNPSTNEYHDEFVEVFNISEKDSISIEGWALSDGQGTDLIISHTGSKKIAPRSFAIILDGSYFLNSTTYDTLIPEGIPVFRIDNNSFGANGLANTIGEPLMLTRHDGDTISLYTYSPDNDEGFSDEKKILDESDTPDNWGNSLVEGGTPGSRNSVSPYEFDAALGANAIEINEPVFAGDNAEIWVQVNYTGVRPISDSAVISLYSSRHWYDEFTDEHNLLARIPFLFQSENENNFLFQWKNVSAGVHFIFASFFADWDMNRSNNSTTKKLVVFSRTVSLHLNEIKFLTGESEPEWIELVNYAADPVFLKSWSISDVRDTMTIDTAVYIHPGQYKVLAADSLSHIYDIEDSLVIINDNFPTLNNSGDEISLNQPMGGWVERINYSIDWLESEEYRNPSLERINPLLNSTLADNWGPCILSQGASPGERNSIFLNLKQSETRINVSPNPFSPDADGRDDATIISGIIPQKSIRMRIRIFDINGRLIQTLSDNYYSGSEFRVVWNGRNNNGALMPIGIYIILIEALNDRNGVYLTKKTSVVLAKKL